MKVTSYTKRGELIHTLWGGTTDHIVHALSARHFERVVSHEPQTLIYKQTQQKNTPQEAVLAIIQPMDAALLSESVLTNYLP